MGTWTAHLQRSDLKPIDREPDPGIPFGEASSCFSGGRPPSDSHDERFLGQTMRKGIPAVTAFVLVVGMLSVAVTTAGAGGAASATTPPTVTISNVVPNLAAGEIRFDVTASEGELRYCYYVDTPDNPDVAQATTVTWIDTAGASHIAVAWDWDGAGTKSGGTILFHLYPEVGVTPALVASIHAECGVRYLVGYRTVKRTRTVQKNGTGTTSRGWTPYLSGGSCNYAANSGGLLVSCLYARNVLTYNISTRGKLKSSFVSMHAGLFPCRTSISKDIAPNRRSIRFTVVTANASGFAQCWIERVGVRSTYYVKVKDYDLVDVSTDWVSSSPSPTASPSTSLTLTPSAAAEASTTRGRRERFPSEGLDPARPVYGLGDPLVIEASTINALRQTYKPGR